MIKKKKKKKKEMKVMEMAKSAASPHQALPEPCSCTLFAADLHCLLPRALLPPQALRVERQHQRQRQELGARAHGRPGPALPCDPPDVDAGRQDAPRASKLAVAEGRHDCTEWHQAPACTVTAATEQDVDVLGCVSGLLQERQGCRGIPLAFRCQVLS